MNAPEPTPSAEPNVGLVLSANCWTPERLKIKDWLASVAPSLGELYEGAVRIVFELRLPGYTRFLGHAVREIRNRLPSEISGSQPVKYLAYKNRVDEIRDHWTKAGLGTNGKIPIVGMPADSAQELPAQISLPYDLTLLIAELIADHEVTKDRPRDVASRADRTAPLDYSFGL
jgi:hypothetical protein